MLIIQNIILIKLILGYFNNIPSKFKLVDKY